MKTRRYYSEEFKRDAVRLVLEEGYSCAEAGRSLEVGANLIRRWKRQFETGKSEFQGPGKLTPDQQKIKDLEAEVRRLKMEKDILKKATAFFVQEKP